MAINLELFISGPIERSDISTAVRVAGPRLSWREGDEPLAQRFFAAGVIGDIRPNPYETDRDLNFDDYPWVIELQTTGADAAEAACGLARRVADELRRLPGVAILITRELQTQLARVPEQDA